jgi:predicted nucleic acid-binding protein
MTNNQIFIDTNVLLYTVDPSNSVKRRKARTIVKSLLNSGSAVISAQVAQEFVSIATKKLKISPAIVRRVLEQFENFRFISVELSIIQDALDCSVMSQISFWDALIVCSARDAGCKELLTEDLNHLQLIRGVRVVNPFV